MNKSQIASWFSSSVFRGAISVALIVLVVANIDLAEVSSALSMVSILSFMILVVIDLLLRLLSAYRWYVLFAGLHESASLLVTTRISLIASFLGQGLPGVIGVEALRVYGLAQSSNDAAAAFASVVIDRVFGLISLVLVIFAGLMIGPQELQQMVLIPATVSMTVIMAIVVLLMTPQSRRWSLNVMPAQLREKVQYRIMKVFSCLDRYKTQPGILFYSLALSVLFQLLRVVLFFAAAMILGESPNFVFFLALVPIVMFVALLPVSISGLGVREASLLVLFNQFDVMDSSQTFAVAILVFVSGLISVLPGGWYYISQRKQLRETADRT